MSDHRWDNPGGKIDGNIIIKNTVSIFACHLTACGIGLDDLGLYEYPEPDLTDNVVRTNDLQGVKGQQISLIPQEVADYNLIANNGKASPVAGEENAGPFSP